MPWATDARDARWRRSVFVRAQLPFLLGVGFVYVALLVSVPPVEAPWV
ncbi:hypothetical protein [Microbacterium luteum]|nr:hypothetical protein [Microbacterium luteum]